MAKTIEIDVKVDSTQAVKGVDNLGKSTDKLKKSTDKVSESNDKLGDSLGAVGGGFSAAVGGAKAFGKSMLALLANPIGLIIGGIAIAILAVKTAFTSSEEGQNKYNKIMAVLGALLGNLMDLLADFGEAIISAFENPRAAIESFVALIKDNIINRFEGLLELIPQLGKAVSALFKGDFAEAGQIAVNAVAKVSLGVDDLTGKIKAASEATKEFIKEQEREGKLAASVADMRAKADKIDRDLLVRRSVLESNIAELRLKSRQEDQFTATERREALIEAQGLENELLDRATEVLELRRDAQILENTFSRSNKENLDLEAKAIAAVNNQVAARANVARQLQRELNTIQGQIDAQTAASEKKIETKQKKEEEIKEKELQLIRSSGERAIEIELELKALRAEAGLADPDATAEQLQKAFEAKAEVEQALYEAELASNEEKFLLGLMTQEENFQAEQLLLHNHIIASEQIKADSIDRIQGKEERAAADKAKNEKLAAQGSINVTQDVLSAVSSLLEEGSAEAKALQTTSAIISGIQGVQAAYTSASAVPIVGVALGPIAAIAAGVVAAKNVQKINSTGKSAKGGSKSFTAPTITPAPSLNDDTLFANGDTETEVIGGGAGINQVKAIVVESDITNTQNTINDIETASEIGG